MDQGVEVGAVKVFSKCEQSRAKTDRSSDRKSDGKSRSDKIVVQSCLSLL